MPTSDLNRTARGAAPEAEDPANSIRGLVATALDRCGDEDRLELVAMLLRDALNVLDDPLRQGPGCLGNERRSQQAG
ncbi:MAG: hypothetical protein ACRDYA_19115 [Egibacteraceae bacterium]